MMIVSIILSFLRKPRCCKKRPCPCLPAIAPTRLLYAGYTKGEIIKKIDLNKEKTQSYTFIEKTQKKTAIKIYEEKFT